MRLAIVLFISGFTGLCLTRCKSPQLKKEIIEQRIENEQATEIVKKYIPEGKDRTFIQNALSKSSELLEVADKARTKAEDTAKETEGDAKKWRWLKGIAIAAGIGLAVFGGFKAFRSFTPM